MGFFFAQLTRIYLPLSSSLNLLFANWPFGAVLKKLIIFLNHTPPPNNR